MHFRKNVLLILLYSLFCTTLWAYQISPLNVTFKPTGVDSLKAYTIINDSDSPIAIEISAHKRMIDINGSEYTEEAPQYFSIQPAKMIIKPQSTQVVRVQYRGPKTVTKEMSFRIIAEQIAYSQGANAEESGQMINFLFVYSTAAYVAPTKVIEKLNATAEKLDDKLVVTIENSGSVHQLLNSLAITINGDDGSSYSLTEDEIKAIDGINLLTNSKVSLSLEIPDQLQEATNFNVDITYKYSYSG